MVKEKDVVNHPEHYESGSYECIDETAENAFDCLTELIKIMTYDVENGGMREAGLKQLEYIRQEYSKLERENCGLNQTVFNLRKRVESKYSSGTPWARCSGIEKVSHD